jgi:hypothetical protein
MVICLSTWTCEPAMLLLLLLLLPGGCSRPAASAVCKAVWMR